MATHEHASVQALLGNLHEVCERSLSLIVSVRTFLFPACVRERLNFFIS